jgi:hypothetical protein
MHISEIHAALVDPADESKQRERERAFRALVDYPHQGVIHGARDAAELSEMLTAVTTALAQSYSNIAPQRTCDVLGVPHGSDYVVAAAKASDNRRTIDAAIERGFNDDQLEPQQAPV